MSEMVIDLKKHPNNLVRTMAEVGYSLEDLLPAYPGKDISYVDTLLRENALALDRPVISYGLLGIHPCRSTYFNVSEHGFRDNGNVQIWPPDKTKKNIFFFGGSTTVGFNIEDGQTIPAVFQNALNIDSNQFEVYNFGSGNYTLRNEMLRFLDLIDRGYEPDYVVFLDGFNDSYYALGNKELELTLDWLYQREKRIRKSSFFVSLMNTIKQFGSTYQSRPLPNATNYIPMMEDDIEKIVPSDEQMEDILNQSCVPLTNSRMEKSYVQLADHVWNRYLDSLDIIKCICSRKGITPLFVWQPIPLFHCQKKSVIMEKLFKEFRYSAFGYYVYNWVLENQASGFDLHSIVDYSRMGEAQNGILYVDICHYTAHFSKLIGERLANSKIFVC